MPDAGPRRSERAVEVLAVDGLALLQDEGRLGWAHLGVPRAGWLDPPSARRANRLVGNPEGVAVVESAVGGLEVRLRCGAWVAVTGADCEVRVDGSERGHGRAEWVASGGVLRLGPARTGVRSYLAVAGGVDVAPVLGSRSTDTLAGVGPPPLTPGTLLPLGTPVGPPVGVDVPAPVRRGPLRVHPGPGLERVGESVLTRLCATSWTAGADSNRVGLRLDGPPLVGDPGGATEMPSHGMVLGAVQLPPGGQPVVFLADHPTTGGYPVVAVVAADDVARCAQLRPGDPVRLRPVRAGRVSPA